MVKTKVGKSSISDNNWTLGKTQVREKISGKALSEMPGGPTVKIALFTQTLVLCILLMGVYNFLI